MPEFIMPDTPELGAEGMAKWLTWAETLGSAMVNPGTPVGITRVLTPHGVSDKPSPHPIMGFSILEAETMEAAMALLKDCPHLEYGGTLEVSEMLPMPSVRD
jgi:hypothetical protein